jgi:hypothetical protein
VVSTPRINYSIRGASTPLSKRWRRVNLKKNHEYLRKSDDKTEMDLDFKNESYIELNYIGKKNLLLVKFF